MELFHGTDEPTAAALKMGTIDVTCGGGELGRGFYCGDILWRAKTWAMNGRRSIKNVLRVEVNDDDFLALDPHVLVKSEAINIRSDIRSTGQTRTFLFNRNAVWSPVVGIPTSDFNQVKWESQKAQAYLNGSTVRRSVV